MNSIDVIASFILGIGIGIFIGTPFCYYFFEGIMKKFSWGGKYGIEKLILVNSIGVGFSNIIFTSLVNDPAGRYLLGVILGDENDRWVLIIGLFSVFYILHGISWVIIGKIFLPFDFKNLLIFSIKSFFYTYFIAIAFIVILGGGYIFF